MTKLLFGTAGIPWSAKGSTTADAMQAVRKLNLDALELEFVHSVNISREKAPEVKAAAERSNITLTCHGQYYINLNAAEKPKLEASKHRLLNAARIANLCGAQSVTFHPGYYLKSTKEQAYAAVKAALEEVAAILKSENNPIWIRPETTGKHSQFGTLKECIQLSQELDHVLPCIDYAHMRARELINTKDGFSSILELMEKELGKEALNNMHIQFAGVKFSEKGELSHLPLKESDLNYSEMAQSWKSFNIKGIAISESPNIEGDALVVQEVYKK